MSVIPPAPRPRPVKAPAPRFPQQAPGIPHPVFLFHPPLEEGVDPRDGSFEFPEQPTNTSTNSQAMFPLRNVVRQFCSGAGLKSVPCKNLFLLLGRLRALAVGITEYNKGVESTTPVFEKYWRPRTLEQLSGFGFQVTSTQQSVQIPGLNELVAMVVEVYEKDLSQAKDLISNNLIVFDALWELYKPSTTVLGATGALGGTPGVFMIAESHYEERKAIVGIERIFHMVLEFVVSFGDHFSVVRFTEVLCNWSGPRARAIKDLVYVPLTSDSERLGIVARGRRFAQYGTGGARFLAYAPNSFFCHGVASSSSGSTGKSLGSLLSTSGRVMVDPVRGSAFGHHAAHSVDEPSLAMVQLSGRYRRWRNAQAGATTAAGSAGGGGTAQSSELGFLWDSLPEEFLLYTWPALVGFSFTAKVWGHVLVQGLDIITFYDRAFDSLVLPPEQKELIRALVRFGGDPNLEDIVGGKRGGSIFLLHGPPGVGKTVTAEAVAEVLHRPLYYITMGELGMTPEDLERRLSDVLDLCAGWNAIALLDEADVFLERRTSADLVRNAMVCVLLRLLEYHPGILFLTTNRVRHFDPAFESRTTVALYYRPLGSAARAQVWRNLLERVKGLQLDAAGINYEQLAKHELNGRQIKNAVRLGVALARERGSTVSQSILELTLRISNAGREEMKSDSSWVE